MQQVVVPVMVVVHVAVIPNHHSLDVRRGGAGLGTAVPHKLCRAWCPRRLHLLQRTSTRFARSINSVRHC